MLFRNKPRCKNLTMKEGTCREREEKGGEAILGITNPDKVCNTNTVPKYYSRARY